MAKEGLPQIRWKDTLTTASVPVYPDRVGGPIQSVTESNKVLQYRHTDSGEWLDVTTFIEDLRNGK